MKLRELLRSRLSSAIAMPIVAASLLVGCQSIEHQPYDLVLTGGRVIDPGSGLDAVRNVGVRNGRIVAIASAPLRGTRTLDVSSLVVAPGFVDLHSHAWTPVGMRMHARDGVTTALELESGSYPVASHGTHGDLAIAGRAPVNFGASVGHAWIRSRLLEGTRAHSGMDQAVAQRDSLGMNRPAFRSPLAGEQRSTMRDLLRDGLRQGGLGIGVLLDYMSEVVSADELEEIFRVAAEFGAPVVVHIRRGPAGDPSGLEEVIGLAQRTGAPLHICHIQANAIQNIAEFMRRVREARTRGLKVTMESFPYNAGSTVISAAAFQRDWQEVFGIDYGDVEVPATGERLTAESFRRYQQQDPGLMIVHHYNREEWTRPATLAPDVIIASDAVPIMGSGAGTNVAPFGIGTHAKVLRQYVRESQALSLSDAIAKMTIMPARMLDAYSPAMRRKGRVQPGADADLVVFDAATVTDNASYARPLAASTGFRYVIVNGEIVVDDDQMVDGALPGRRVLRNEMAPR
jgi:N-acyl-D-aspartate/D-glutamate deacylase